MGMHAQWNGDVTGEQQDDGGAALLRLLQSGAATSSHAQDQYSRSRPSASNQGTTSPAPHPWSLTDPAVAALGPSRPVRPYAPVPGGLPLGPYPVAVPNGLPQGLPMGPPALGQSPGFLPNQSWQYGAPQSTNPARGLLQQGQPSYTPWGASQEAAQRVAADIEALRRLGSGEDLLKVLQASTALSARLPPNHQPPFPPAMPAPELGRPESLGSGRGPQLWQGMPIHTPLPPAPIPQGNGPPPDLLRKIWGSNAPQGSSQTLWQPMHPPASYRPMGTQQASPGLWSSQVGPGPGQWPPPPVAPAPYRPGGLHPEAGINREVERTYEGRPLQRGAESGRGSGVPAQQEVEALQAALLRQLGFQESSKKAQPLAEDSRNRARHSREPADLQQFQELETTGPDNGPERLKSPGAGAQALAQATANAEAREHAGRLQAESLPLRPPGPLPSLRNLRDARLRPDLPQMTAELLGVVCTLIPSAEEDEAKSAFVKRLTDLMAREWPGAKLHLFGSCANAFGLRGSDVDVCLAVRGEEGQDKGACINRAAEILRNAGMKGVQALTHARVPIVKFSEEASGLACDICVNNLLAVANTKLLYDYAAIDPRLRQLAALVKFWAKQRQVNETYRGTLSSYAYVLMCIHFLQTRSPPILPCLQAMEPPTFRVQLGGVECAYFDRVSTLRSFGAANTESLAHLLAGFFEYWAHHDYNHAVISVRSAHTLTKEEKGWTRRVGNERHLICIEDPFEISHDLGRVVDRSSIRVLRDEFHRAAKVLRHDANPVKALFERYVRKEGE